ncbi:nuclear transport factor 2 family protein [Dyadobacter arcticus]|uniref:Ketosteroid isomerase-like protein n=1 Tax=Dyadobacter arcticus TaxID=1078754 RepID=A0ABX0USR3_9BACT|nr:nuclear transport factor 2 family protein [Dyadobacter arcticus]NIJ54795.1 ketosteroid isomerase-like protein [Dyadobacter arcticus]
MKKRLLIFVLSSICVHAAFAQTADEKAIVKTIEDEKTASDNADYKAYLSHWVKTPYASFLYNGMLLTGDNLWKAMDQRWANAKPHKNNNIRTDWNIHVNGNAAFVTFSQQTENEEKKITSNTAEARFLEKINGEWKIASMVATNKPKE